MKKILLKQIVAVALGLAVGASSALAMSSVPTPPKPKIGTAVQPGTRACIPPIPPVPVRLSPGALGAITSTRC